jgi:hypothetical protein
LIKRILATTLSFQKAVIVLVIMACCFAVLKNAGNTRADFTGYVEAGNLAFHHTNIYASEFNTWPPTFSFLCIPLYLFNQLSPWFLQFFWLAGTCIAFYFILKWAYELVHETRLKTLDWKFIVPLLLCFRIFYEELINVQINVYMLFFSILALRLIKINKHAFFTGLSLAITICCKVYTLILLPFLVYKKKYQAALFTIVSILIFYSFTAFYFGWAETRVLFQTWANKDLMSKHIFDHNNQSIWSFITGLTTDFSRFNDFHFNLFSLSIEQSKLITLSILALLGIFLAIKFYTTAKTKHAFYWQALVVLSLIPVVSPLAWKYYFVFLSPLIITLYPLIAEHKQWKWAYYIPLFLIILCSELFVGSYFSDVLESLGIITFGSLFFSLFSIFIFEKSYE